MRKLMWRIVTVIIILISWVMYSHPDWVVDPPSFFTRASAAACVGNPDGKCEFNPGLSQWIDQTGGKDGLANQPTPDQNTPNGSLTPATVPGFQGK